MKESDSKRQESGAAPSISFQCSARRLCFLIPSWCPTGRQVAHLGNFPAPEVWTRWYLWLWPWLLLWQKPARNKIWIGPLLTGINCFKNGKHFSFHCVFYCVSDKIGGIFIYLVSFPLFPPSLFLSVIRAAQYTLYFASDFVFLLSNNTVFFKNNFNSRLKGWFSG